MNDNSYITISRAIHLLNNATDHIWDDLIEQATTQFEPEELIWVVEALDQIESAKHHLHRLRETYKEKQLALSLRGTTPL